MRRSFNSLAAARLDFFRLHRSVIDQVPVTAARMAVEQGLYERVTLAMIHFGRRVQLEKGGARA